MRMVRCDAKAAAVAGSPRNRLGERPFSDRLLSEGCCRGQPVLLKRKQAGARTRRHREFRTAKANARKSCLALLSHGNGITMYFIFTEMTAMASRHETAAQREAREQRQKVFAARAVESSKAATEYRAAEEAVRDRTARLRSERSARESATQVPAKPPAPSRRRRTTSPTSR